MPSMYNKSGNLQTENAFISIQSTEQVVYFTTDWMLLLFLTEHKQGGDGRGVHCDWHSEEHENSSDNLSQINK